MKDKNPDIYFHVGLGKVASTFLQYRYFPKLKDICYIQRTHYKQSPLRIQKGDCEKYLVSREFDRQLHQEAAWFAGYFPNAKPIILLRQHDQWVASQYRRYVKNGGYLSLEGFLDLDNNQGRWDVKEAYFMPYIRSLDNYFAYQPLVLFYEDLKANPQNFFDTLAEYMAVNYDWESIDMSPFHASYSEKQLKFMRKFGSRWFKSDRTLPGNPILKWLKRRGELLMAYTILYSAWLAPDDWVKDEVLYPPDYLSRIREFYKEDWEACQNYAEAHNPAMG